MNKLVYLLLICVIPTMYSCKEKKVTYADNGKVIDLVVGQVLKIELPANTSTGNTWRRIAYNDSVIIKKGKPNYMLGDDRIGSPGVYYYRFTAIAEGKSVLQMEYGSKYDDKKPALKNFEITVVVHNKQ